MKKPSLLATSAVALVAALAALAAAPLQAQQAQQSANLTIYGVLDLGLHMSNNGGTDPSVKLASSIAGGSRLGVRGVEDLGGGYQTIFTLEGRIEPDTGRISAGNLSSNQGFALTRGMEALPAPVLNQVRAGLNPDIVTNPNNALFDRLAIVGMNTPLGKVTLGRHLTPAMVVLFTVDPFELGTAGSWAWVNSGTGGALTAGVIQRSDKSIQYSSPTQNGLSTVWLYGFKNSGDIGLNRRLVGGNLTYHANGLYLGLAHNRADDQTGQRSLVSTVLGGSYASGDWKWFGGVNRFKNDHATLIPLAIATWDNAIAPALAPLGAARTGQLRTVFVSNLIRNFRVDATAYTLGAQLRVGKGRWTAAISHQTDKTEFDAGPTLIGLGYDYFISPRTDIYSAIAHLKNKNQGQFTPGAAGSASGFTATPGAAANALQIGVRHRF